MGDVKHEGRRKKRGISSSRGSSSLDCSGETASYDLEAETVRLNDLITRLQDGNYWVPLSSDSLEILHRLLDCTYLLLKAVVEATGRERVRRTNGELKKLAKTQKENQAIIIEEMKKQHETKIRVLEGEKVRDVQEQASIIEGLTSQQDATLQALDDEKEKSICQICFIRPRDAVVLTCMHFLYCGDCLEAHKSISRTCPTCRGVISGICKLNL